MFSSLWFLSLSFVCGWKFLMTSSPNLIRSWTSFFTRSFFNIFSSFILISFSIFCNMNLDLYSGNNDFLSCQICFIWYFFWPNSFKIIFSFFWTSRENLFNSALFIGCNFIFLFFISRSIKASSSLLRFCSFSSAVI